MNAFEQFAADSYLCDYPKDMAFDELLEKVRLETEDIIVWETYDRCIGSFVADRIEDMATRLTDAFTFTGVENMK